MTAFDEPVLPYAGSSGHSGGHTSKDRADREDRDGTTSKRQATAIQYARKWQGAGTTWKELAHATGWHHGQASGVLSVLHKTGHLVRLTERRARCSVYVLPEYVYGRDTIPHGSRRDPKIVKVVVWPDADPPRCAITYQGVPGYVVVECDILHDGGAR